MYLQRLLQINTAAMVALGATLLGMGERSGVLPLGVFIAAVASVWLTDITRWFRLNRIVTNVAAVVAFVIFFFQLSQVGGVEQILAEQILAIGKFLVYLQIILLFQEKDARTYGCLALLSLVQVVVAAAFHQPVLFGVLLVVYLIVGLSVLVLLFLHRERASHRSAGSRSQATVAGEGRWPLARQQPTFTDSTSGYAGQAGLGRELPARVARIALGTLLLTVLLFLILPRWGRNPWRGVGAPSLLSVGFSSKVTLGELGPILQNPQEVLRIRFFDGVTGKRYRVFAPVYLRGVELTHYADRAWEYRESSGPPYPDPAKFADFAVNHFGARPVVQRIVAEPTDHEHDLFAVWPFLDALRNQRLVIDRGRQRMMRVSGSASEPFEYELITSAFHHGAQLPFVPTPDDGPVGAESLPDRLPAEGPGALPALTAQAKEWIDEAGLSDDDPCACAQLLQRRLRDSERFKYSLEGQPRDASIDPIEDFITNNPRGHCEYFATALTLMLQSRGIPARMVVGFKCDEWNDVGHFFQVRQLHAHTWVEAYLEPGQVAPELLPMDWRGKGLAGGWLRLDPTPADSDDQGNSLLEAIAGAFDWLDFAWGNYVIEMDRPRQHEAIYEPVSEAIKSAARRLTDPAWWRSVFGNVGRALRAGLENLVGGRWFSWRGGVLAMVAALVLFLFYRGIRLALRIVRSRLAGRLGRAKRSAPTRISFYRRLEAVLARLGLRRGASQTQREFAREAAAKIAASTGRHDLGSLPGQVVEAFYRVRFGAATLDNPQADAVEHALTQLEKTLGGTRQGPSGAV